MDGVGVTCAGGGWLLLMTTTVVERDGISVPGVRTPDLEGLDDQALVKACQAGRREAFDEIVVRHRRAVYRLCYRFAGNHEDATDLAQEVFLRAFRALGAFKGDAAVGTWLYRIAVNLSLNAVSSRTRRTETIEERTSPAAPGPDAVSRVILAERQAQVRDAIAKLPPKQRATLILRVYHDLPHQEIARLLGNSVGAVKANFFHALKSLERLLRKDVK
jgi:RNA polymerase sigma-70 factor, ECF subfamily